MSHKNAEGENTMILIQRVQSNWLIFISSEKYCVFLTEVASARAYKTIKLLINFFGQIT